MHRVFDTLFCIIFVISINGVWLKPPASIDTDAIELTQLMEKFWSLKPIIFKRTRPWVYCQVIDKCCEDEDRSEAVSLISQYLDGTNRYRFIEVIITCMSSSTLNKADQLCSSIFESIIPARITYQNSDVKKYIRIIRKYKKELDNIFDQILSTCNSEEVHAFFCLSNKKLMETCVVKILQKLYDDDDDDKNDQDFIVNTKQLLIDLNQQLSEAFIENTDGE